MKRERLFSGNAMTDEPMPTTEAVLTTAAVVAIESARFSYVNWLEQASLEIAEAAGSHDARGRTLVTAEHVQKALAGELL